MHRVFQEELPSSDLLRLTGEEFRHLARSRRAHPGEEVFLFDGRGDYARGRLLAVEKKQAVIEILERGRNPNMPAVELHLASAVPQGKRINFILEKGTELGMKSFQPVNFTRSTVRLEGLSPERRRRWREIAIEACKQCGRNLLPEIENPVEPRELAHSSLGGPLLVCHRGRDSRPLLTTLEELAAVPRLTFLVGPEGGLNEEETAVLGESGAHFVTLGGRTLRVETACLCALAVAGRFYEANPRTAG